MVNENSVFKPKIPTKNNIIILLNNIFLVKVNGEVEYQRGKKLYDGDVVTFEGETIKIEK